MPSRKIQCEQCKETFIHFTVHKDYVPKKFCNDCIRKRARERYHSNKNKNFTPRLKECKLV